MELSGKDIDKSTNEFGKDYARLKEKLTRQLERAPLETALLQAVQRSKQYSADKTYRVRSWRKSL